MGTIGRSCHKAGLDRARGSGGSTVIGTLNLRDYVTSWAMGFRLFHGGRALMSAIILRARFACMASVESQWSKAVRTSSPACGVSSTLLNPLVVPRSRARVIRPIAMML